MANAVVRAARERGLDHEEMHSQVEYVVAHGIATRIEGKRTVIGSRINLPQNFGSLSGFLSLGMI